MHSVLLLLLRGSHPDGLDDLEDGRADDDEDEERDQLGRDGVAVVLAGRLGHVASLEKEKESVYD